MHKLLRRQRRIRANAGAKLRTGWSGVRQSSADSTQCIPAAKRLQVTEGLYWRDSGGYGHDGNGTSNLYSTYTYGEGKITAVTYPTTTNDSYNGFAIGPGTYPALATIILSTAWNG